MSHLNFLDIVTIMVYLGILVSLGLYLKKKASGTLEDYFLGANKMPWWMLGISGMSSYIDMAGTMVIVSFLYILGPRGLYIEFRGGAVLILVFMLLWSGKWHFRSRCMTGAEWMEYRFGNSWGGRSARVVSAIAQIMITVGMLAYLIKALGMFVSMFLPFSPTVCALFMISVATIYTIVSGFYGVVYTDLFQSLIVISAIIFISVLAIYQISGTNDFASLAAAVTGNSEWTSSSLKWQVSMPKGYEDYKDLMLLAFFYFLRNMFIGVSSAGADPKYFGARNERECGTLTFLWTSLMMFRWPMMIGFAVLGIFLVNNLFPDQTVLLQTSVLIKQNFHNISKESWPDLISNIINHPQNFNPALITGIKNLLQDDWQSKLHLLSYNGNINAENILPAVVLFKIPMGVRGFLLIAFIAAALSCFNSIVNSTTGYFTKDIYQRFINPEASNRKLILASYFFIIFIVTVGFILAYNFHSIAHVWGWIIMGLGGGLAIPSMLKFYWWRYNGSGFAIGTMVGIIYAFIQTIFFPGLIEWQQFCVVSFISLVATIISTYVTKPTEDHVLEKFYITTRPFGFWKPYKARLDSATREKMEKEHRNDLLSVPFTFMWQVTIFLMPMQLIIQSYRAFMITFAIFSVSLAGMYFFWYKNLPPKTNEVPAETVEVPNPAQQQASPESFIH